MCLPTPNALNFLAKEPTLIGVVQGHAFYEHPTRGDESPLIAITHNGKLKRTDFWDLPTREETEIFDD